MGRSNAASGAVRVQGEMNIYRAAELAQTVLPKLRKKSSVAKLDLSEVTEIDTAGLQLLLVAHRSVAAAGGRLQIVNPSECVSEVLELCNLQHLGEQA